MCVQQEKALVSNFSSESFLIMEPLLSQNVYN